MLIILIASISSAFKTTVKIEETGQVNNTGMITIIYSLVCCWNGFIIRPKIAPNNKTPKQQQKISKVPAS